MVTRPVMVKEAAVSNSATSSGGTSAISQELDRNAFLQLLVTQLQHQDPLNPTDNTEFIAQLAQFSSLEQMQQMNTGLTNQQLMTATSQALSLVGREVSYTVDGSADPVRGKVESVRFSDGQPKLVVGDVEVDPANVVQVW